MGEFLRMGGYAAFVWPAYGASVIGIAAAIFLTLRAYAAARAKLAALEKSRA